MLLTVLGIYFAVNLGIIIARFASGVYVYDKNEPIMEVLALIALFLIGLPLYLAVLVQERIIPWLNSKSKKDEKK